MCSSLKSLLGALAFLAWIVLPACSHGEGAGSTPQFSGDRAMDWLEKQCAIGPRTPGSEGNIRLRGMIMELAAAGSLSVAELCFSSPDPMGDKPVRLCNLVVSAGPREGGRLWLGAHFDTRPVCDKDPDPAKRGQPLPGANDGASGVAVLLHLMELFAEQSPARGVDLLFLDGEDSGSAGKPEEFCLGSAYLARTWQEFGGPLSGDVPDGVIILDMIGDRDLSIPMEQYSLRYSRELVEMVFQRAGELGLDAFVPVPGAAVFDDHVPFIRAGIPAVDLIDFDYPFWHTAADTPEACSAESLAQVGILLVDLLYNP